MEIEISWTKRAEKGLSKTIAYLKVECSKKEFYVWKVILMTSLNASNYIQIFIQRLLSSNICIKEWWMKITISSIK